MKSAEMTARNNKCIRAVAKFACEPKDLKPDQKEEIRTELNLETAGA